MFEELFGLISTAGSGSGISSSSKCNHCGKILFLVVGVISLAVLWWPNIELKRQIFTTEQQVKEHAYLLCHGKEAQSNIKKPEWRKGVDVWDVTLKYASEEVEDPYATMCLVTSAGPDKEFGTDDDISAQNRNLHKSKIVGKWVGYKSKEAAKSFWRNLVD